MSDTPYKFEVTSDVAQVPNSDPLSFYNDLQELFAGRKNLSAGYIVCITGEDNRSDSEHLKQVVKKLPSPYNTSSVFQSDYEPPDKNIVEQISVGEATAVVSRLAANWVEESKHPAMLSKIHDMLQVGGILKISMLGKGDPEEMEAFNVAGVMRTDFRYAHLYSADNMSTYDRAAFFTAEEYTKLLEDARFTDISINVIPGRFQPHSRENIKKHFKVVDAKGKRGKDKGGFFPDLLPDEQKDQFLEDWLEECLKRGLITNTNGVFQVVSWAPKFEILAIKSEKAVKRDQQPETFEMI